MKGGINHFRFSSNMQGVGEGIAVFKEQGVSGGHSGCAHSRSKQNDDAGFKAWLTIKRWHSGSESVFGGLDEFALGFRGNATASGLTAKGSILRRSEATSSGTALLGSCGLSVSNEEVPSVGAFFDPADCLDLAGGTQSTRRVMKSPLSAAKIQDAPAFSGASWSTRPPTEPSRWTAGTGWR